MVEHKCSVPSCGRAFLVCTDPGPSFNKDLVTKAGKVKRMCPLCRERRRSVAQGMVRKTAKTLLSPPSPTAPLASPLTPRAPPGSPREEDLAVDAAGAPGDDPPAYEPREEDEGNGGGGDDDDDEDLEHYTTAELVLFDRIGVNSYAEINEEILGRAPADCVALLRNTLRIAQERDPSIKGFADFMPKSESRWPTTPRGTRLAATPVYDVDTTSGDDLHALSLFLNGLFFCVILTIVFFSQIPEPLRHRGH